VPTETPAAAAWSGPFTTNRRVEFRDTDAAGIVHFSAFFVYMEQAEHEMLRQWGLSVVERDASGEISWPRVAAQCEFRSPAKFEDLLDISVTVQRLGSTSVTYGFRFECHGREIAVGTVTAVCCRMEADQPPRAIDIPQRFREKLRSLVTAAAS
jgi:acyl-CoA thioester hydrolase